MVLVEIAKKVVENENFSGSIIDRAIELGVLETVQYAGAFSSYAYIITRDSFHDFIYKLKISERQINDIMDNI